MNEQIELKNGDVVKFGPDHLQYIFQEPTYCEVVSSPRSSQQSEVAPACILDPVAEEIASLTKKEPEGQQIQQNASLNVMESELTCSICSELFIKAVTLTCSHTFCKYCISEWSKNNKTCPICRMPVKEISPTIVLDNFIEKFLENQNEEIKQSRQQVVSARESMMTSMASTSKPKTEDRVIEISEDDEDDLYNSDYDGHSNYDHWDHSEVDSDVEDEFDDDDDESTYNGIPGRYYGGYGRCYFCNQRGHWANGCPWK